MRNPPPFREHIDDFGFVSGPTPSMQNHGLTGDKTIGTGKTRPTTSGEQPMSLQDQHSQPLPIPPATHPSETPSRRMSVSSSSGELTVGKVALVAGGSIAYVCLMTFLGTLVQAGGRKLAGKIGW